MTKTGMILWIYYILLFVLSCWNWLYMMAISSDIPVNITVTEFVRAAVGIAAILLFHIYLVFRGNNAVNLLNILFPNGLWISNFIGDMHYHYHSYSTILSTSMIGCMAAILIANVIALALRRRRILQVGKNMA